MIDGKAKMEVSEIPVLNMEIEDVQLVHITERDHNKLNNRDVADQHPIEAITGLGDKLSEVDKAFEEQGKILEGYGQTLQLQGAEIESLNQFAEEAGKTLTTLGETVENQGETLTQHGETITKQGEAITQQSETIAKQGETITKQEQILENHSQTLQSQVQAITTATTIANSASTKANEAITTANQVANSTQSEISRIDEINHSQDLEIEKLKAALEGNLYLFKVDDGVAYEKKVPVDVKPYATLDKIGGKTLVWNQYIHTVNSNNFRPYNANNIKVTFSNEQADIEYLSSGYGYGYSLKYDLPNSNWVNGHIYYIAYFANPSANSNLNLEIFGNSWDTVPIACRANVWTVCDWIVLNSATKANRSVYFVRNDKTTIQSTGYKVKFKNPMVIDLTAMFGAGNEPATPEEFRAMFPAEYYPYSEPTLINFSGSEVVSMGRNIIVDETIKSGSYYSDGNGTISSNNNFVCLDLGALPVKGNTTYTIHTDGYLYSIWEASGIRNTGNLCHRCSGNKYTITTSNDTSFLRISFLTYERNTPTWVMAEVGSGTTAYVPHKSMSYNTSAIVQKYFPDGMKSAGTVHDEIDFERMVAIQRVGDVDETGLAYTVLETPIETPITELFEETVEVESGGALTFKNDHGDDYQVPVPNQETFMIKLPNGGTAT